MTRSTALCSASSLQKTGLITDRTVGMIFRHGILLKNGAVDRRLVVHELAHVMQYERCGGIEAFLKEYVKEVVFDPGYPHGPLEKEAERLADGGIKNPSQQLRRDGLSSLEK